MSELTNKKDVTDWLHPVVQKVMAAKVAKPW